MLLLLIAGCSKDSSHDAEALLETVPADADFAVVLRLGDFLEKAGCKVSDSEITLSKDIRESIEQMKDSASREVILSFVDGKSGINPEVLCVFGASHNLVTGLLKDPVEFKKFVEKEVGHPFVEDEGVNVNGSFAYIGNQFWFDLGGQPEPADLARYAKLSKKQSFAGKDEAALILDSDRELTGLADLSAVLQTRTRNRAQLSMALSMMFDDASSLFFTCNANKKLLEINASLINAKGKKAKFLLPVEKLDTKTIASLGGESELLAAISLPKSLVKKFTGILASLGGGLSKDNIEALENIDGTAAFAGSMQAGLARGVITTASKPSAQLVEMTGALLGCVVTVRDNSMVLNFDNGNHMSAPEGKGGFDVAEAAKDFKGAIGGIVTDGNVRFFGYEPAVSDKFRVMLMPVDGSLELRFSTELNKDGILYICEGLM